MTAPSIVDTHVLGIQGKVYIGATPGTTASSLLNDDQEVTLKVANTMAKRATRGTPRKTARPSTQELSIEMTIAKDPGNAQFVSLHAAAMSQAAVAVKAIDAVAGGISAWGNGWDGDFYIESWEESQPEDDWDGIKVSLAFTDDYRALSVVGV